MAYHHSKWTWELHNPAIKWKKSQNSTKHNRSTAIKWKKSQNSTKHNRTAELIAKH
jgi:hypothetical protein